MISAGIATKGLFPGQSIGVITRGYFGSGEEIEVVTGIARFSFKDRYVNNEFVNPAISVSFKDKHIPSFEMAEITRSFKDKHIIEFETEKINNSFKAKGIKTQESRDVGGSFKDRHIKTAEDAKINKSFKAKKINKSFEVE